MQQQQYGCMKWGGIIESDEDEQVVLDVLEAQKTCKQKAQEA